MPNINKITNRILTTLLADKKAWKWEGKGKTATPTEPNVAWLEYNYWRTWEYLWVDEIYLAQMYRAYHLFKLFANVDENHFSTVLTDGIEYTTIECEDCLYELQSRLSNGDYTYPALCFTDWWIQEHPEWQMQTITIDLINEISTKPMFDHQPALF